MSYARYKFNKAVQSLNEAGPKRREWLTSEHVFRLMRLTADDIPKELAAEFQQLQREIKPIVSASEFDNPLWSAMHAVDDTTARRIVERIRLMHQMIESKDDQKKPQVSPAEQTEQIKALGE